MQGWWANRSWKGGLMRFEMNANGFIDRAETHGEKPVG